MGMNNKIEAKRVRVQLDLMPDEAQSLDALKEKCGLRSRSDAVRTALAVLEWIERESRNGNSIVAVGEDGVSKLVVPGITT